MREHEHRKLAALAEAHRTGSSPWLASINYSATGCGHKLPSIRQTEMLESSRSLVVTNLGRWGVH